MLSLNVLALLLLSLVLEYSVGFLSAQLCIGKKAISLSAQISRSMGETNSDRNERKAPSSRSYRSGDFNNKERNSSNEPGDKFSAAEKEWKSGQIFGKQTQRRGRNDPWWMREDEAKNPRILPAYSPWWMQNIQVDVNWKLADLQKEGARRGIDIKGMKKKELLAELQRLSSLYDLSDNGFVTAAYTVNDSQKNRSCFPHVYETETSMLELLPK
jgi:hypothetical protein